MTARRVLIVLCAAMLLLLIVRTFWSGGSSRPVIALDDKALADLDAFVALLDRSPIEAVRSAMFALPGAQPKRHGEVFQAVLDKSKQKPVREAAMVGWRSAGTLDAATLARLLKSDPDESVRVQAAAEIARQRLWDSAPDLFVAMRDGNAKVRAAAHNAVTGLLGLSFRFDANAPPPSQDAVIENYRVQWASLRDYYEMDKRLREAQKKRGN